jgi:hypothetical protein
MMCRTLIALVAAVAASASAAGFAATDDPHQRVREIIVPPPGAHPVPSGVAEYDVGEDAHARVRNLIRDERKRALSVRPDATDGADVRAVDPHRRLESIIRGTD